MHRGRALRHLGLMIVVLVSLMKLLRAALALLFRAVGDLLARGILLHIIDAFIVKQINFVGFIHSYHLDLSMPRMRAPYAEGLRDVPERTRTSICPLGEDCSILLSYENMSMQASLL